MQRLRQRGGEDPDSKPSQLVVERLVSSTASP
jgi:hypothetical protein